MEWEEGGEKGSRGIKGGCKILIAPTYHGR